MSVGSLAFILHFVLFFGIVGAILLHAGFVFCLLDLCSDIAW
jgi:hypothetical protein